MIVAGMNILLLILYFCNILKLKKINKNYKIFMKKIGNGNNIDEMLKNYINKVDDVYSFSPRKMYYKETNNYITKYYIYGTIEKSTINQSDEAKDYYIIVYLDSQNMTFAVEPYDGEIFND